MRLDHLLSRETSSLHIRPVSAATECPVGAYPRSTSRTFRSVRCSLSFWSLGLGMSLAGLPAGLDSSPREPGQFGTFFRSPMEGLQGEDHPSRLNLLRDAAEVWACSSVG